MSGTDKTTTAGVLIRDMKDQDVPAGLRLCRASGWNQLEADWHLFLQLSPSGCRVAEKDGEVVGTVATLRYQDRFSWLSMVLVDPQERRAGIGTRLLYEGLGMLRDDVCTRLDATSQGRQLYIQHGFLDEYSISRLKTNAVGKQIAPVTGKVRPMCEGDVAAVLDQDRVVFGADREPVLRSLLARSPEYAWIAGTPKVKGYCFGRPGFLYPQLGPIVADNESIAAELISECLAHNSGQRFGIDAPQHCASWLEWLTSNGFSEERSFVRMHRGQNKYPGRTERVFGVVGPEFG